jgi:uncharacterized protein YcnI
MCFPADDARRTTFLIPGKSARGLRALEPTDARPRAHHDDTGPARTSLETTMRKSNILAPVVATALIAATSAYAHVTLETQQAAVGSTYKAVLRVPHGCNGKATTKIRVQIPEGVIAVKPQPKAGWTLDKVKGQYAKSYDYYGTAMSEGVKEVVWSGGNLPDDEYDEFVLRAYLTGDLKPETVLYFPVVQECPDGAVERWIEIPEAGKSADDYETPAPGVKLLPKK